MNKPFSKIFHNFSVHDLRLDSHVTNMHHSPQKLKSVDRSWKKKCQLLFSVKSRDCQRSC